MMPSPPFLSNIKPKNEKYYPTIYTYLPSPHLLSLDLFCLNTWCLQIQIRRSRNAGSQDHNWKSGLG